MESSKIFIVHAMISKNEYKEEVWSHKVIRETPNMFICKNARVLKEHINEIQPAYYAGQFKTVVVNEEDIVLARTQLKGEISNFHNRLAEKEIRNSRIVNEFDITNPLTIKNGG